MPLLKHHLAHLKPTVGSSLKDSLRSHFDSFLGDLRLSYHRHHCTGVVLVGDVQLFISDKLLGLDRGSPPTAGRRSGNSGFVCC